MSRLHWLILVLNPAFAALAQTNAVPPAIPSNISVIGEGLYQSAQTTRSVTNIAIEGGKMLGGELDAATGKLVDRANDVGDSTKHLVEAYKLYRADDGEGMLVYGTAKLTERLMDHAVEAAIGPELVPAWRFGRGIGEIIREIPINGVTIESRVTDFYFNHLDGRRADEEFARITSEQSIEQHRQKLHAERMQRFSAMNAANEQAAAASRTNAAADASAANDAAVASSMMSLMLPAMSAAATASRPSYSPVVPAPPAAAYPSQPDAAATRHTQYYSAPPVGGTFGSPPSEPRRTTQSCPPRNQLPNFCRGNAECGGCYQ